MSTAQGLTTSLALLSLDKHEDQDQDHEHNKENNHNDGYQYQYQYQYQEHGFTNDAMEQLNASRQLLTMYKEHQMKCIDDAKERTLQTYTIEQNKITSAMNELRSIQRQRGISIGVDVHDDVVDVNDGTSTENQATQKEKLYQLRTEVERNLANLHLKQKQVQKKVMALREEEKEVFARAEQKRKAKERIEKSKQVTVEDLTIAVVKYKELGLDFVKGEDQSLKFNFTKLYRKEEDDDKENGSSGNSNNDNKNNRKSDNDYLKYRHTVNECEEGYECERKYHEEQMCSFTLQVTPDTDEYQVEDCIPELDPDVVMRLVDGLNRNEDDCDPTLQFPTFIRGMRKAFKDYLAMGSGRS